MNDPVRQTTAFLKKYYQSEGSGHDWWHCYRVWKLARKIWEHEGGDLLIIELAALLHDIDDYKFHHEKNTAEGKNAKKWLEEINIEKRLVSRIIDIICSVNFKGNSKKRNFPTIEYEIVQDADFLDAIGAIGIARTFTFGGYKGHLIYDPDIQPIQYISFDEYKKRNSPTINHFYEKLLLLDGMIKTSTGKKISSNRHKFLQDYLHQFMMEWDLRDYE